MTWVQAYTRFMILFFVVVSIFTVVKPLTDAPGHGMLLWPEAAKSFGLFLINWFHFVVHMILAVAAVFAAKRVSSARHFARWVFAVCAVWVLIGLITPDGVWLLPARWPADVASGQPAVVSGASW